jgi:hypothetical protein
MLYLSDQLFQKRCSNVANTTGGAQDVLADCGIPRSNARSACSRARMLVHGTGEERNIHKPEIEMQCGVNTDCPCCIIAVGILEIAPHEPPGEPLLSHVNSASVKHSCDQA